MKVFQTKTASFSTTKPSLGSLSSQRDSVSGDCTDHHDDSVRSACQARSVVAEARSSQQGLVSAGSVCIDHHHESDTDLIQSRTTQSQRRVMLIDAPV